MKLYLNYLCSITCLFFLAGCSQSLNPTLLEKRQTGVVDSCYTVLEYNSDDKFTKIDSYLSKKVEEGILTNQSATILRKCLDRTISSKCWRTNE